MKGTFHLIPHVHWDREWYLTFARFRVNLVDIVGGVLEALELEDDYRHFLLDGQAIVLEDYLEAVPEDRERVARFPRVKSPTRQQTQKLARESDRDRLVTRLGLRLDVGVNPEDEPVEGVEQQRSPQHRLIAALVSPDIRHAIAIQLRHPLGNLAHHARDPLFGRCQGRGSNEFEIRLHPLRAEWIGKGGLGNQTEKSTLPLRQLKGFGHASYVC